MEWIKLRLNGFNMKTKVKFIKKKPIVFIKHENLEDENRKHEYKLKMINYEEDYWVQSAK